jgi:subtilisin-like proprotein convertase family protein
MLARTCFIRGALAAALSFVFAMPVFAAVPGTLQVEGALLSAQGSPAADGVYAVEFAFYDAPEGGVPLWLEKVPQVDVKGGSFQQVLGLGTPIKPAVLAKASSLWIGVRVGQDPELARRGVRSVVFALAADVAQGLACSGCITAEHLAPEVLKGVAKTSDLAKVALTGAFSDLSGAPDLSGYAKSADLHKVAVSGKYVDLAGAPALSDVALSGKYGDLKDLPVSVKAGVACGTGLVVRGIKADGALECVATLDPKDLPKNAIASVSNGLLDNKFVESVPSKTVPLDILDNNPGGITDSLVVPPFGTATSVAIRVKVAGNHNVGGLNITVTDPAKNKYELAKKTLKSGDKEFDLTWPPEKLVAGDLGYWVGKDPKGTWFLTIVDDDYQDNKNDGKLVAWSVEVGILSSQKVAVKGNLVLGSATAECNVYYKGAIRWNEQLKALQACDGDTWFPRVQGDTKDNPGLTCKAIKDDAPGSKSGAYWIDPDGAGGVAPFQAWCDQDTDGGGWTLVVKVKGNDTLLNRANQSHWRQKNPVGGQECFNLKDQNAICEGYDKVPFRDVMIRSLGKPWRNLGFGLRDTYASVWQIVNAGQRVWSTNRLFGSIGNLDHNNDPRYVRDCSGNVYGFFTADWSQNNNGGIVGHSMPHGHAGGVVGSSLNDWDQWSSHSYDRDNFLSTRCISDFALGGGYGGLEGGNNAESIQAHWWGNGNGYSHDWNSHGLFVR